MNFEQLQAWSQQAYQYLGRAKDATFELASAVMRTRHISCARRFSPLIPYFGVNGRASMKHYKIVDQTPDKLMQLYIQQLSQVQRPVLASDRTAWLRPMHLHSKKVPMNINPQHYLTAYQSASVKDLVRSH